MSISTSVSPFLAHLCMVLSHSLAEHPLAHDFLLTEGSKEVTLPENLPSRSSYILVCECFGPFHRYAPNNLIHCSDGRLWKRFREVHDQRETMKSRFSSSGRYSKRYSTR